MKKISIFVFLLVLFNNVYSQDTTVLKKFLDKTDISGQYFLAYNYNLTQAFNQFMLKRGYFTIKSNINKYVSVRYTQDITLDKEGADAGNVEIRLKYLYMKLRAPEGSAFENMFVELGLVHRPWGEFEQRTNHYRVYRKMYSEKYSILNSADFGITIVGNIGENLSAKKQKILGKKYAGRYGSYAVGVYNGGGYHAIEKNNNKVLEGRLTIRPFPDFIPGLQFTHVTSIGKANLDSLTSKFNTHLFFVSSKGKFHTLTAQYHFGKGNYSGKYMQADGTPLANDGFTAFAELIFFKSKFSVFSRYDLFRLNNNIISKKKAIGGGVAFHFLKSKVILFYQNENNAGNHNNYVETALEIVF